MERSPEAVPRETLKPLGLEESKLTLVVSRELDEKLQRLKGLLAHRLPHATYAELLDMIADVALQKLDPQLKKGREAKRDAESTAEAAPAPERSSPPSPRSRAIPAHLKRLIWKRAQGQCEYAATGKRCSSRYALQMDHIHPFGKGGESAPDNLQLLCRTHNAHKNLDDYGFLYRHRVHASQNAFVLPDGGKVGG